MRRWPHLFLDRPKPGFIIVNTKGERFGDEASLNFVEAMHRDGAVPAHLICDAKAIRKYGLRSEEHTSELQSLMRISYAVFCLKKKNNVIIIIDSQRLPGQHITM